MTPIKQPVKWKVSVFSFFRGLDGHSTIYPSMVCWLVDVGGLIPYNNGPPWLLNVCGHISSYTHVSNLSYLYRVCWSEIITFTTRARLLTVALPNDSGIFHRHSFRFKVTLSNHCFHAFGVWSGRVAGGRDRCGGDGWGLIKIWCRDSIRRSIESPVRCKKTKSPWNSPCRELTYPTRGKGKSSSKVPWGGGMLVSRRGSDIWLVLSDEHSWAKDGHFLTERHVKHLPVVLSITPTRTPPKFNSSPLKSYLLNRKGSSSNHLFSGAMLNLGGEI